MVTTPLLSLRVPDPFEQIGPKLRDAREAAGLDLAEAARQARVPTAAAAALEEENFSHFDSPVYAKSFLLQYSEFLKVDAKTWLDALEPGSFMASGALLKGPETPTRRVAAQEQQSVETRGGGLAVIILLLVTAAIVYGVIKGFEFFESRQSVPDQAPATGEASPGGVQ